jgi:MYXO-CTERM domain-containing protein
MVDYGNPHQWNPGIGFIGFRFNNGAGVQYGWARIKISGVSHYDFVLLDYAYADPGERLTAGQTLENTSSDEQAPDQGSLGGLALGAVGLLAWRKSRKSLTARLEDA